MIPAILLRSTARLQVALMAIAVLGVAAVGARAEDRSPVERFAANDADMNVAIARARATLPAFWASHDAPKMSENRHMLKVRYATDDKGGGEHIWISDVKKLANGRYAGRFGNEPVDLPGKRMGDPTEFADADISDWMFMRNGKIVGGETIKVGLKRMPKADADALRARMETP